MRQRQLLVVHSSRAASTKMKRYLLSELVDIQFTDSESGQDALKHLNKQKNAQITLHLDIQELELRIINISQGGLTAYLINRQR